MPNPQQPELRRSGRGATVDDSAAAKAQTTLGSADDGLPDRLIPEESRPGHRPADEQDRPDLDRFAERLGLRRTRDHAGSGPSATAPAWPLGLIRALALTRVVLGAAGVLAPPSWLVVVFGRSARRPLPTALVRMVGMRDTVIGIATLAAAREGSNRAAWMARLGALCDATDGVAAIATPGLDRRARRLTVPSAAAAALAGLVAAAFARDASAQDHAASRTEAEPDHDGPARAAAPA